MKRQNLLFVIHMYPNVGGLESVSNTIIDYLASHFNIYTLSITGDENIEVAPGILRHYYLPKTTDPQQQADYYNELTRDLKIDCVINQGMFPRISDLIFNDQRNDQLRVFSFLHGMPKCEAKFFWQIPMSRLKFIRRKLLAALGRGAFYRDQAVYNRVYHKVCRWSERVVMLCDDYIDEFIQGYHVEEYRDKIISIPNPLPPKYLETTGVAWSSKRNMALYCGRLSNEKRIEIILDVWHRAALGADWELLIIGDGDEREKLEQLAKQLGIANVRFVGRTLNPESYYAQAKINFLATSAEGFGMGLIEGQCFGAVPLAFDSSAGVRSIVAHGGGVLVPLDDRTAMVDRLRELASDDDRLRKLSQSLPQRTKSYQVDQIGLKWIEMLKGEI